VGTELFHADGRTDMTKLIFAFRNFASALKNRDSEGHISLRGINEILLTFSTFFGPIWIEFDKGYVHENLLTLGL